ncbi:TIGR02269 family lipoprotein [Myxococcus sp. K15C18031901]|uniref:SitA6 family polymorphic toxin lipoprotein n=1 Tax=Myxococcus dinghuensis TaxID=2906761 RepID=UPI0020A82D37|nr:TIGR02269 family lipoprotein [Myxococcus dinghuensis]MCP3101666.1 TIGR02269 family lipoprotein [Myxococcus dinghuensis]
MRLAVLLWCAVLVTACASMPDPVGDELLDSGVDDSAEECARSAASGEETGCYAPACSEEECGLFRCEDLASPPLALRFPPAQTGGATARIQRYWGGAMPLPGRIPVFIIPWYRRDELPSVKAARKAIAEWTKRPKERHHIFPRAFAGYFEFVGIDIHQYTLLVAVEEHQRVHAGGKGGPWNRDWRKWIEANRISATRDDHFKQGGRMIAKYGLLGMPMTYWETLRLYSTGE